MLSLYFTEIYLHSEGLVQESSIKYPREGVSLLAETNLIEGKLKFHGMVKTVGMVQNEESEWNAGRHLDTPNFITVIVS